MRAHARSTEITASIVEDTRREVAEVASINDREPVERRACVAGLGEAPFRVSFEPRLPPEEAEDEGPEVRFRIDPSQYIAEYYAQFSFFTSLDTREHVFEETGCGNLPPAVLSDLEGTPYEIGLLKPLHDALQPPEERVEETQSLDEAVPGKRGWEPADPRRARQAGVSVGRDGVVVTGPAPPG